MKRAIRIAIGSGVLAAGLAFAAVPAANAQVRIGGSFRVPHGRLSVSIGDLFPIGGYVPYGYDVYQDPSYGYGFVYDDQWIPCEPYGSSYVIIGAPVFYRSYGYRSYGYRSYRPYYGRSYSYRPYYGRSYSRDYGRYDGRRYSRDHRYDYRNDGRNWDRNRHGRW